MNPNRKTNKPTVIADSRENQQTGRHLMQATHHQGPIPDPVTLQQYNGIDPTFAERIVVMAEKEQSHRHDCNKERLELAKDQLNLVTGEQSNQRYGIYAGIFSVILIVGLCAYAFYLGYSTCASAIAVGVIIGLAGIFVIRQYKSDKKEKEALPTTKETSED